MILPAKEYLHHGNWKASIFVGRSITILGDIVSVVRRSRGSLEQGPDWASTNQSFDLLDPRKGGRDLRGREEREKGDRLVRQRDSE